MPGALVDPPQRAIFSEVAGRVVFRGPPLVWETGRQGDVEMWRCGDGETGRRAALDRREETDQRWTLKNNTTSGADLKPQKNTRPRG